MSRLDRKKSASASYTASAREVVRTDGNRERNKSNKSGEIELDFDPGDEKATVSNTRGFKSWFSTRDAGLTVESTVTVTVRCGQDSDSIEKAVTECGKAAEEMAHRGANDMGLYITEFQKDIK